MKAFILALVLMPVVAVLVFLATRPSEKKEEKNFAAVPSFELTTQKGTPFHSDTLKDKIWVANFIFTRCAGQCPILSEQFQRIQKKFQGNGRIKLVSFTADPEYDKPARLQEYAKRYEANASNWFFLTGERPKLKELIEKGFYLTAGEMGMPDTGMITHSEKFVLVDPWMRIRGYFDGTDEKQVAKLIKRVTSLSLERF